ncbi:uncharacterized protein [Aquarana catesbeiana]|uniref:uncharacterized protein n=1 Tax=Aquarana catesbeiana TaxID=8400 RepID=UPI003CCA4536
MRRSLVKRAFRRTQVSLQGIVMNSQPPNTSPDGSGNGNPPERCPRPLYSRDSTQEHHKILRCYQYKRLKHITTDVKNEAKETSPKSEKLYNEEEVPIEISTDPGNTKATQRNVKADNEERRVKSKMKILEIGMDGRYRWYNAEKYPDSEIVDEDITAYVAKEKAMTPTLQPVCYKEEKPYSCPECGKRFTHEKYLIIHYRSHSGEKPFFCAECGKSFPYRSSLDKHKITHTAVGAFPCPECGKRFRAGWILAAHQKVHSSENLHR